MISTKKHLAIIAEIRQNNRLSDLQGEIWEIESTLEELKTRVKELEQK